MEGVVGGEVRLTDLVLAVRVARDERDDLLKTAFGDDGQLRRDLDRGYVGMVSAHRVVDRRCGLAPVDDLQVLDAVDPAAAAWQFDQAYFRRGAGDAVVVGKEPARLVEDR